MADALWQSIIDNIRDKYVSEIMAHTYFGLKEPCAERQIAWAALRISNNTQ